VSDTKRKKNGKFQLCAWYIDGGMLVELKLFTVGIIDTNAHHKSASSTGSYFGRMLCISLHSKTAHYLYKHLLIT